MRFMMLMYPGVKAEEGVMPTKEQIDAMTTYNEELVKAGVLMAGEGLHPTSKGARVTYTAGKATVTDGPFTESKEILGGFWIINVASEKEAVEWATRVPGEDDNMVEVRRIYEMEDFDPATLDVEKEKQLRAAIGG